MSESVNNSDKNCDLIVFRFCRNPQQYDLEITDVHAVTELYFTVHTTLSSELKTYHVIVICMNCVCCTCYTVISALCIFRLYINFNP